MSDQNPTMTENLYAIIFKTFKELEIQSALGEINWSRTKWNTTLNDLRIRPEDILQQALFDLRLEYFPDDDRDDVLDLNDYTMLGAIFTYITTPKEEE